MPNASLQDWIFVYVNEKAMPLNPPDARATCDPAAQEPPGERYILRLYVTGLTRPGASGTDLVRSPDQPEATR